MWLFFTLSLFQVKYKTWISGYSAKVDTHIRCQCHPFKRVSLYYYYYHLPDWCSAWSGVGWPAGDVRENKEHPDVNKQHEENVEEEFADDLFTQVQRSVDDDQHKLGQKHR